MRPFFGVFLVVMFLSRFGVLGVFSMVMRHIPFAYNCRGYA